MRRAISPRGITSSAPRFGTAAVATTLASAAPSENAHAPPPLPERGRYARLLESSAASKALGPGRQLHGRILVCGLASDVNLRTKLLSLYSFCGRLPDAHRLFDELPKRSAFVWNVLIRAYVWDGPCEMAIQLYHRMVECGIEPDNFTFPPVLKACASLAQVETGREVQKHVFKTRWESDVFVGAGLVDMYAKCGSIRDARAVFDSIPVRDTVLWNSIIGAYGKNGCPAEALSLCRDMAREGVRPTTATLVSSIAAAADAAMLNRGRELHGFGWRHGFALNDKLKTALVDMYAKTGLVWVARTLFENLLEKQLVSWNAMICGYGMHGHAEKALALFHTMRSESQIVPDFITFVGVMTACSHGGLMKEGEEYFDMMVKEYSICPRLQHYTCLVDLLGHCGRLDEAHQLIKDMPMVPDAGVWGALLNGCKIHRNVELAEVALKNLIKLEPNDSGNYILLSNIYSQSAKYEEAAKVRKIMTDKGMKKISACSWIEVKRKVHGFLVGDNSHPRSEEIYNELERLEGLMVEAGYIPDTMPVLHDVGDDEKRNMVRGHSERLAIAFGLLTTPPGTRILITKNLRVCEDCHVAIKYISKIVQREIIIRDVNRYHHFVNGNCSCRDYW